VSDTQPCSTPAEETFANRTRTMPVAVMRSSVALSTVPTGTVPSCLEEIKCPAVSRAAFLTR